MGTACQSTATCKDFRSMVLSSSLQNHLGKARGGTLGILQSLVLPGMLDASSEVHGNMVACAGAAGKAAEPCPASAPASICFALCCQSQLGWLQSGLSPA